MTTISSSASSTAAIAGFSAGAPVPANAVQPELQATSRSAAVTTPALTSVPALPGMERPAVLDRSALFVMDEQEMRSQLRQAYATTVRVAGAIAQMYTLLKSTSYMLAARAKEKSAEKMEDHAETQAFAGALQHGTGLAFSIAGAKQAAEGGIKGVRAAKVDADLRALKRTGEHQLKQLVPEAAPTSKRSGDTSFSANAEAELSVSRSDQRSFARSDPFGTGNNNEAQSSRNPRDNSQEATGATSSTNTLKSRSNSSSNLREEMPAPPTSSSSQSEVIQPVESTLPQAVPPTTSLGTPRTAEQPSSNAPTQASQEMPQISTTQTTTTTTPAQPRQASDVVPKTGATTPTNTDSAAGAREAGRAAPAPAATPGVNASTGNAPAAPAASSQYDNNGWTDAQRDRVEQKTTELGILQTEAGAHGNKSVVATSFGSSLGGVAATPISAEAELDQAEADKWQAFAQRSEASAANSEAAATAADRLFGEIQEMRKNTMRNSTDLQGRVWS